MGEATPLHFTFSKRKISHLFFDLYSIAMFLFLPHLLSAEFEVSLRLSPSCVCQSVSVAMDSVVCVCFVCECVSVSVGHVAARLLGLAARKKNRPFVSSDSNF